MLEDGLPPIINRHLRLAVMGFQRSHGNGVFPSNYIQLHGCKYGIGVG